DDRLSPRHPPRPVCRTVGCQRSSTFPVRSRATHQGGDETDMGSPHPNSAGAMDTPGECLSRQQRADLTIMNDEANPSTHYAWHHRREPTGRYGELVWRGAPGK